MNHNSLWYLAGIAISFFDIYLWLAVCDGMMMEEMLENVRNFIGKLKISNSRTRMDSMGHEFKNMTHY